MMQRLYIKGILVIGCILSLSSCLLTNSNNGVGYLDVFKQTRSSADKSLADYVVLKNGDTIQGAELRAKSANRPDADLFYRSKKLKRTEYVAYQTEGIFSTRFVEIGGMCCAEYDDFYHRIRKGKINAYYMMNTGSISSSSIGSYSSAGSSTKIYFYFQKGNAYPEYFTSIEILRKTISDNSKALEEFNRQYSTMKKKKKDQHYNKILKIIDIYNGSIE